MVRAKREKMVLSCKIVCKGGDLVKYSYISLLDRQRNREYFSN